MTLLILSEKEIQQHYVMKDAYEDMKRGIIAMQHGDILNPFRTVIDIPDYDGSGLYMPSADFSEQKTATKVVTIFPHNPQTGRPTTQGIMLLSDATNGEHVCMMNASYLTRLRTGALSAIGTNKLARKNAQILGVIGTGGMAFEQVLGVLEVRDMEKILLFNRTEARAYEFKQRLQAFGVTLPIQVVKRVDELVQTADIINCATRSNDPVFDGKGLLPGTHINGVGSYLPTMREVDVATIERSSIIVVDDMEGIKEEAGELIHADHSKNSKWTFADIYGELTSLEMNEEVLLTADDEITFFKSVGAAYFDLIVANGTYKKAQALGLGQTIKL